MTMIARNEEAHVHPCFESFWSDVDEVVLVDTGSTDGTVTAVEAFALEKGEPSKLIVGHFDWCDDFSAARSYADSLATGDWLGNIDPDERAVGLKNIDLAAMPPWCIGLLIPWKNLALEGPGKPRIKRAGACSWSGRIHERAWSAHCEPLAVRVNPATCHFEHTRDGGRAASVERDVRIASRWRAEEPGDVRAPFHLAHALIELKRFDEAAVVLEESLDTRPQNLGAYLLLAQMSHSRNDLPTAIDWARRGLSLSAEESVCFPRRAADELAGGLQRLLTGEAPIRACDECPGPRVSRNAPCPCGSGRKAKKCCQA